MSRITDTNHRVLTPAIEAAAAAPAPKPSSITPSAFALAREAAELALIAKYPHCRIVRGTLVQHFEGKFKNKKVVQVRCGTCNEKAERATSDLFTYKGHCKACIKALEKAERARLKNKVDLSEVEVEFEQEVEV